MQTLFGDRLERNALSASCAPAVALPGQDISYAELVARVRNCAAWLAREGCTADEVVGITVELREPAAATAEELMVRARELLGVCAPRKIIVLDALPRNAAGKVVKRELAELLSGK